MSNDKDKKDPKDHSHVRKSNVANALVAIGKAFAKHKDNPAAVQGMADDLISHAPKLAANIEEQTSVTPTGIALSENPAP